MASAGNTRRRTNILSQSGNRRRAGRSQRGYIPAGTQTDFENCPRHGNVRAVTLYRYGNPSDAFRRISFVRLCALPPLSTHCLERQAVRGESYDNFAFPHFFPFGKSRPKRDTAFNSSPSSGLFPIRFRKNCLISIFPPLSQRDFYLPWFCELFTVQF